jgi:hypothetical protein
MKSFFGIERDQPTLKKVLYAIVVNTLTVLWAALIVYLAFTNLPLACVGFFSFMFSYLMGVSKPTL